MSAWVLSGYSGFLPQSRDMHDWLIGVSKLPVRVNVRVSGCLSLYVSPAMNWRLVQGVPRLSPKVSWDRLQPPATLMDKRLQRMDNILRFTRCFSELYEGLLYVRSQT